MAKNKTAGDNKRIGAVKDGLQVLNQAGNRYIYRYIRKVQFMDVKSYTKPTKVLRQEK